MLKNLREISKENCSEKLYPIYKLDYSNIFNEFLSEFAFDNLLRLESFKNKLDCAISDMATIVIHIEKYLFKEEKDTSLETVVDIEIEQLQEILEIWKNKGYIEEFIFNCTLISVISKNSNYMKILEYVNSENNNYKIFKQELINIKAKKDKERYLKGDFSIEKEKQKQEVEYSNVQNGYEFEEYVANLYKKLGYTIEEVTKKSGDQRSRCNCL